MKIEQLIIPLLVIFSVFLYAFTPQERAENYISGHKKYAIENMYRYRIPASICMAQAIQESFYGSSDLSYRANNHFGIKCNNGWDGPGVPLKDDDFDENGNLVESCFRKYDHVQASFDDYGVFLSSGQRYQALFELSTTDYKAWAYGLKECGYATREDYAERLIELIERYNLQRLDTLVPESPIASTQALFSNSGSATDGAKQNDASFNDDGIICNYPNRADLTYASYVPLDKGYSAQVEGAKPTVWMLDVAVSPPPCPTPIHNPMPIKTQPKFRPFALR